VGGGSTGDNRIVTIRCRGQLFHPSQLVQIQATIVIKVTALRAVAGRRRSFRLKSSVCYGVAAHWLRFYFLLPDKLYTLRTRSSFFVLFHVDAAGRIIQIYFERIEERKLKTTKKTRFRFVKNIPECSRRNGVREARETKWDRVVPCCRDPSAPTRAPTHTHTHTQGGGGIVHVNLN